MKTVSLAVAGMAAIAALAFWAMPGAGAPPTPHLVTPQPLKLAPPRNEAQPSSMGQVQLTFAPVVKRIAPAVVNVYTRTVTQVQTNLFFNDPFFSQFFGANPGMRQRVQQSLGSGVIVRADGLILTNNHVVDGGTDIVVALNDKREFKAKVLTADPRTDLAVLKIDTKGEKLPTVPFGDSDAVQVGDLVLAVGDPFGVGQTVTMALSRRWRARKGRPMTISSIFRPMPPSIRATPAAHWSPPTENSRASTPRSIRGPAAISASALPFPPIWRAGWWRAWKAAAVCVSPGSAPLANRSLAPLPKAWG